MDATQVVLMVLVFGSVTALVLTFAGAMSGGAAQRLRTRLMAMQDLEEIEQSASAIRARYLRQLPPIERALEELPGMRELRRLCEQAGRQEPAYRLAAMGLALAIAGGTIAGVLTGSLLGTVIGAVAGGGLVPARLFMGRAARLAKFEEQLPDALDLMGRSLRAGNPLLESFKFISEEMRPPISEGFGRAWSNINFGVSLKAGLADLADQFPTMALQTLSTAVLVQRETGGNLAEILDKITQVLRARTRFQRRLRSLTAEGRVSAAVLGLMPFVLAGVLSVTSPTYLPILFQTEQGQKLLVTGLALMALGIVWILRIIKIRA